MLFERIVCGVDGSPRSLVALDQALRLLAPEGHLVAVTARYLPLALLSGLNGQGAATVAETALSAQAAAAGALADLPRCEARLLEGDPSSCLLAVAAAEHADLLAVGAGQHGRPSGLLFGDVDSNVVRRAPCPVLVARGAEAPGFPAAIAVGVDGSGNSLLALRTARNLSGRTGASLRVIAAAGEDADLARVTPLEGRVELDPRTPVEALVDASVESDLLVVGSRGLRGPAALGSVSEHVARTAACSVLVVRPAERTQAPRPLLRGWPKPKPLPAA